MKRILVIGIGNLLRKDDGIGVKVVSALVEPLKEHGIAALIGETDVPFCLAEIMADDFLILVDAASEGNICGKVVTIPFAEALHCRSNACSPHEYSLFDAIFFSYPQMQGCFIAIEGADFDCGLTLSEPLQQRFGTICEEVLRVILEQRTVARGHAKAPHP